MYDDSFVERFVRAFGEEAAVYLGGPDQQQAPGLLIHGFPLPGAVEISPGTRIYTGGVRVPRPNFSAEFNETADRSCILRYT